MRRLDWQMTFDIGQDANRKSITDVGILGRINFDMNYEIKVQWQRKVRRERVRRTRVESSM